MKKLEKRKAEAERKIAIIKQFVKDMGDKLYEEKYNSCVDGRPIYTVGLSGIEDCEGNPYSWYWYTDAWEEGWKNDL